jgi:pyruvate,orthophosphate dikinase
MASNNNHKLVYFFGFDETTKQNKTEGDMSMKALLGGKGANLAEMAKMDMPVPQGFTISTEACALYTAVQKNPQLACPECKSKYDVLINKSIADQVEIYLKQLEVATQSKFLHHANDEPNAKMLLVSVRSGAAASMPGMMDTILNIGLNDELVERFAKQTGNEKLAYDSYRRLMQMFSGVVLKIDRELFEQVISKQKKIRGIKFDSELSAEELKQIVKEYKEIVAQHYKSGFPQNPKQQMYMSIEAVFQSWNNKRAIEYRRLNNITNLKGTAVNVQRMVFGNANEQSGTGVAFSRNPSTGENQLFGEFLKNAQGEDVVAGIRTPEEIHKLATEFPDCYQQLCTIAKKLEHLYRDVQDMEFTIQDGKFFMLQTRNGKLATAAAIRAYVEMVLDEKLIDEKTALKRINPLSLDQVLHLRFDEQDKKKYQVIATGLATSPGAAVGRIAFDSDEAVEMSTKDAVILVRRDTEAEDLIGIAKAQGILTSTGGRTSHAAVVARGMGKCCISGCQDAIIDEKAGTLTIGSRVFKKGDYISLDGTYGYVYGDKIKTLKPEMSPSFKQFMEWEKKYRKMGVRVNADTTIDTQQALEFGADGVGLCRTEHMFFEKDKIVIMREVILAEDKEQRVEALKRLKPYQKKDFADMFRILKGRPFTVRLLDPPLHEFLPTIDNEHGIEDVATQSHIPKQRVIHRILELKEFNPMIGRRGCRVGVMLPEITQMQAEAFFEAAAQVVQEGIPVHPEVMVPLISTVEELENQKKVIDTAAQQILAPLNISYKVGCMIETPRACLTSDKIGTVAQFFSVGSNDLTQTTFAFSRDDSGKFIPYYVEHDILKSDPFVSLDEEGVAELIKIAVAKGRSVNPQLEIGLCGEVGGEPASIQILSKIGLDYVSCSPYRVLIARLAACQAVL